MAKNPFSTREVIGDLLEAPDGAVLVHATNCQGVWGHGTALKLKKKFPMAFEIYARTCANVTNKADLVGTCLLIPPQSRDPETSYESLPFRSSHSGHTANSLTRAEGKRKHWIACLFTSVGYGRRDVPRSNPGKDSLPQVLEQTLDALLNLRNQLETIKLANSPNEGMPKTIGKAPGEIWSCKFNSGAFEVPWRSTKALMGIAFEGFDRNWTVVELAGPF